jgi:hypothetical protein
VKAPHDQSVTGAKIAAHSALPPCLNGSSGGDAPDFLVNFSVELPFQSEGLMKRPVVVAFSLTIMSVALWADGQEPVLLSSEKPEKRDINLGRFPRSRHGRGWRMRQEGRYRMSMPGMTAEASLYRSNVAYGAKPASGAGTGRYPVRLAQDSCTCTSPNCTWSCPGPPPPPVCPYPQCRGLRPGSCPWLRCCCIQGGGDWVWVGHFPGSPCGYVCT